MNKRDQSIEKMQSVIAVACKVIRIFYTILTKGVTYDGEKMLKDIIRPAEAMNEGKMESKAFIEVEQSNQELMVLLSHDRG